MHHQHHGCIFLLLLLLLFGACADACTLGSVGTTTCTRCPAGFYSNDTSDPICHACSPGSGTANYPADGATTCVECQPGQYSYTSVATYTGPDIDPTDSHGRWCVSCGGSGYTATSGATVCTQCTSGTHANANLTGCVDCAAGTYGLDGACFACVAGKNSYAGTVGTYDGADANCTPLTNCTAGRHTSDAEGISGVCVDCEVGRYSAAIGTGITACSACAPGTFNNATAASTCQACEAGTGANFYASIECVTCQTGAYSQAGRCEKCDFGYASNVTGATSSATCRKCAPGSYAGVAGTAVCTPCATGFATNATGAATCVGCARGTYATGLGNTACRNCSINAYSVQSPSLGNSVCFNCTAGRYNTGPGTGTSVCEACLAGRYSDAFASGCLTCPAGTYSGDGAPQCYACAAGRYASAPGSGSCTACPAGRTSLAGSTVCQSCVAGRFASLAGQTSCQLCPAGRTSTSGATSCLNCAAGKYSDAARLCQACGAGTYATYTGSSVCTLCSAGTVSSAGASTCQLCPAGTYVANASTCTVCPEGWVSGSAGAPVCQACNGGTFANANHTACVPCSGNTYAGTGQQSTCLACPMNSTTIDGAQTCASTCTQSSLFVIPFNLFGGDPYNGGPLLSNYAAGSLPDLGARIHLARHFNATALRAFVSDQGTGGTLSYTLRLWSCAGVLLRNATVDATDTTGWVEAALPSPVLLAPGEYLVTSTQYSEATAATGTVWFDPPVPLSGDDNGITLVDSVAGRPGAFPHFGFAGGAYANFWIGADIIGYAQPDGLPSNANAVSPGVCYTPACDVDSDSVGARLDCAGFGHPRCHDETATIYGDVCRGGPKCSVTAAGTGACDGVGGGGYCREPLDSSTYCAQLDRCDFYRNASDCFARTSASIACQWTDGACVPVTCALDSLFNRTLAIPNSHGPFSYGSEAPDFGVRFRLAQPFLVRALRVYIYVQDGVRAYTFRLWRCDATLLATTATQTPSGGLPGWIEAPLAEPLLLPAGEFTISFTSYLGDEVAYWDPAASASVLSGGDGGLNATYLWGVAGRRDLYPHIDMGPETTHAFLRFGADLVGCGAPPPAGSDFLSVAAAPVCATFACDYDTATHAQRDDCVNYRGDFCHLNTSTALYGDVCESGPLCSSFSSGCASVGPSGGGWCTGPNVTTGLCYQVERCDFYRTESDCYARPSGVQCQWNAATAVCAFVACDGRDSFFNLSTAVVPSPTGTLVVSSDFGVRFRLEQHAFLVRALRAYVYVQDGVRNYTLRLWGCDATLLATAAVVTPTSGAPGWIEAPLPTALLLAQGGEYVVSFTNYAGDRISYWTGAPPASALSALLPNTTYLWSVAGARGTYPHADFDSLSNHASMHFGADLVGCAAPPPDTVATHIAAPVCRSFSCAEDSDTVAARETCAYYRSPHCHLNSTSLYGAACQKGPLCSSFSSSCETRGDGSSGVFCAGPNITTGACYQVDQCELYTLESDCTTYAGGHCRWYNGTCVTGALVACPADRSFVDVASNTCVCSANFVADGGGGCVCRNTTSLYGPACLSCPVCAPGQICDSGVDGTGACIAAAVCDFGWQHDTSGRCQPCGSFNASASECIDPYGLGVEFGMHCHWRATNASCLAGPQCEALNAVNCTAATASCIKPFWGTCHYRGECAAAEPAQCLNTVDSTQPWYQLGCQLINDTSCRRQCNYRYPTSSCEDGDGLCVRVHDIYCFDRDTSCASRLNASACDSSKCHWDTDRCLEGEACGTYSGADHSACDGSQSCYHLPGTPDVCQQLGHCGTSFSEALCNHTIDDASGTDNTFNGLLACQWRLGQCRQQCSAFRATKLVNCPALYCTNNGTACLDNPAASTRAAAVDETDQGSFYANHSEAPFVRLTFLPTFVSIDTDPAQQAGMPLAAPVAASSGSTSMWLSDGAILFNCTAYGQLERVWVYRLASVGASTVRLAFYQVGSGAVALSASNQWPLTPLWTGVDDFAGFYGWLHLDLAAPIRLRPGGFYLATYQLTFASPPPPTVVVPRTLGRDIRAAPGLAFWHGAVANLHDGYVFQQVGGDTGFRNQDALMDVGYRLVDASNCTECALPPPPLVISIVNATVTITASGPPPADSAAFLAQVVAEIALLAGVTGNVTLVGNLTLTPATTNSSAATSVQVQLSETNAALLTSVVASVTDGGTTLDAAAYPIFGTHNMTVDVQPIAAPAELAPIAGIAVVDANATCAACVGCRAIYDSPLTLARFPPLCTNCTCGCRPFDNSSAECDLNTVDAWLPPSEMRCVSGASSAYPDVCTSLRSTAGALAYRNTTRTPVYGLDAATGAIDVVATQAILVADECTYRDPRAFNLMPRRRWCQSRDFAYGLERHVLRGSYMGGARTFTLLLPQADALLLDAGAVKRVYGYVTALGLGAPTGNKAYALVEYDALLPDDGSGVPTVRLTRLTLLDEQEGEKSVYYYNSTWTPAAVDCGAFAYAYYDATANASACDCFRYYQRNPMTSGCEAGCASANFGAQCETAATSLNCPNTFDPTTTAFLRAADCALVCLAGYVDGGSGACVPAPPEPARTPLSAAGLSTLTNLSPTDIALLTTGSAVGAVGIGVGIWRVFYWQGISRLKP